MANYLAHRIIDGVFTYEYVIEKRSDLKDGIDKYLIEKGKDNSIVQ